MPGPLYPLQPTFARGELSPRLFSRADLDHWKMGLAECVNWMILKQGGLRRRPGSEWINRAKTLGQRPRLIPFIFSIQQAYVLEFGAYYVRFYANGGIVNKGSSAVTFNTTTNKVLWTAHGMSNGDPVFFTTTNTLPGGITEGVTYYIINKGTDDFQIAATVGGAAIDLTGSPLGTHTALVPVELATPYSIDDVWEMQCSQSADVLYIAHGDFQQRKLTRTSGSTFTLATYVAIDGPYLPQNTTTTTLDPSGTSGDVTITASAVTGINGDTGFDEDDVGRPIQILYSAKWWWYLITDIGSEDGDFTITIAAPGVATSLAHGMSVNDPVRISTTGALPTGLAPGDYFIKTVPTLDTFTLSATLGGAAIDTSGTQSGVHSFIANPTLVVRATVKGLVDSDGEEDLSAPSANARAQWRLGAWSEITGWPATVGFFQQRLVWGRTATQPQTIWMSKAGVLDNFSTTEPAQEDDAITITILAGEVNAIQWIAEGSDLLIGTTGAIRTIGSADSGKNFSGTNLVQKRQSTFGSMAMQPVQVGNVAVYASYYGLSLREFVFSIQQNAYIAPELSILSEHVLRSGVVQMTYAQDHDSIIWCAMGNGELVGITYERDQNIVAVTRHRLGGEVINSGIDDPTAPEDPDTHYGVVESVATIPGDDRTEIWLSVKRTINGTDVRYIERLTVPFEAMEKDDGVFVDSSFTYDVDDAPVSALSGVNWLKGETVSILSAGSVEADAEVSSIGGLTLPSGKAAEKITFGLKYLSRAKTLRLAMGLGDGTGLGRKKNIIAAKIDVMETGWLEVGAPSARKLEVACGLRGPNDPMDTSPPLQDGFLKDVHFDRGWETYGQVIIQTDKPLPATIRSITPVFEGEP